MEIYDKYFQKVLYGVHLLIFKSQPGDTTKRFIKNLFYAMSGVGGATLITFGFNVLAIRYLGPTEFGKWNLISSIAELFVILPLWGLTNASLRYLGSDKEHQKEIIGTSFRTVFLLSLLLFPSYLFFSPSLQKTLAIDNLLFSFAVIYALVLVFFYIFQSFFQGSENFKKLSFLWIGSAFIFVGVVWVYLFGFHDYSFKGLYWGNLGRLLLIILAGVVFFNKELLDFSSRKFKKLFTYGSLSMLSVFAGFFSLGATDNLMINYFMDSTSVGIYSAYYIIFAILTGRIFNTFSQTFIPAASGTGDVKILFSKAATLTKRGVFPVFLGNILLIWILFRLYGKEFSFDIFLAMIISLSTSIYCFRMIFGNILASRGIKGAKFGPIFALTNACLNILFNLILIPKYGIHGAALATLMTVLITLSFPFYAIKKYFYY